MLCALLCWCWFSPLATKAAMHHAPAMRKNLFHVNCNIRHKLYYCWKGLWQKISSGFRCARHTHASVPFARLAVHNGCLWMLLAEADSGGGGVGGDMLRAHSDKCKVTLCLAACAECWQRTDALREWQELCHGRNMLASTTNNPFIKCNTHLAPNVILQWHRNYIWYRMMQMECSNDGGESNRNWSGKLSDDQMWWVIICVFVISSEHIYSIFPSSLKIYGNRISVIAPMR